MDLAREHGISTQAVRNYEDAGVLPVAERTASGYRTYTARHASALRAYLALIRAHGYATAGAVMRAVTANDLAAALALIDRSHVQLHRDRATLQDVRVAVDRLVLDDPAAQLTSGTAPLSIGELARSLELSPATLRAWERVGILRPVRDVVSGQRRYDRDDLRDAELAHLLRRGGQQLQRIAVVLEQVRTVGGTYELMASIDGWQQRLTDRGAAMLRAAALLSEHLESR